MRKLVQISLILIVGLTFSNCEKKELLIDDLINVNEEHFNDEGGITNRDNNDPIMTLTNVTWNWETYTTPSGSKYEINTYRNCPKRPLIIAIHGGAFTSGDLIQIKPENFNKIYFDMNNIDMVKYGIDKELLTNNKIAYATINYKLCNGSSVLLFNSLADIGATIKHIRDNADYFNIDENNIILIGDSAGSCAALYFGLKSNLNEPIKGIVCFNSQATIDITKWKSLYYDYGSKDLYDANIYETTSLIYFIKTPLLVQYWYGTTNKLSIQSISAVTGLNFLNEIDADDPEIYLSNTISNFMHNLIHSSEIIAKSESVGHKAKLNYSYEPYKNDYVNPQFETVVAFCLRKFSGN